MDASSRLILDSLPADFASFLTAAKEALAERGALYLVGGSVRDALLKRPGLDIDVSVEGMMAQDLGERIEASLGGELRCHADFLTCTLELPSTSFDLVTTRSERYARPGALPEVDPGSLHQDLARRDFSINALAFRLYPAPTGLLDPLGGLKDLETQRLRVLHARSFLDDPTRIVRGARLAGRLGFDFEPQTRDLLTAALSPVIIESVSGGRWRTELELTLAEPRVLPALKVLEHTGALQAIYGLTLDEVLMAALDERKQTELVSPESDLLLLQLAMSDETFAKHLRQLALPERFARDRALLLQARDGGLAAEQLERLDPSLDPLLKVLRPELGPQIEALRQSLNRRRVTGNDVLDLGLLPGPAVGAILRELSRARARGALRSYEAELALVKRLVDERRASTIQE